MKWQIVKLQNLASDEKGSIVSGPFGSNISAKYFVDEGVPVIRGNNLTKGEQKFIDDGFVYLTETKAAEFRNCIAIKDDLVFTAAGSIGQVGIIPDNTKFKKYVISNKQLRVRIDEKKAIPLFVYYWLSSTKMTSYLEGMNNGGAVPLLNLGIIRKVPIPLPTLDIQNKICAIISNLDDLIDTNRRRIQLLEESARLLFREWFVYFRFPRLRQGFGGQAGHEKACPVESINSTGVKIVDGVPEGWEKEKLIKIGYLNYGKALVEETREEGDVKVYGSSGVVGVHSKSLVEGPGIIVGRKGNVGAIHWVNDSYWPIDTVYYIKKEQSNLFLYLSLKIIGFINTDASVPGLNRDYAHNKTILVPTKDLLDKFLNQVNDIYRMVKILTIQNQKLAHARDLLLPRLMSGAIEV